LIGLTRIGNPVAIVGDGAVAAVYVKVVEVGTEATWKVPLYCPGLHPETNTRQFVERLWGKRVVTVTVVPDAVMLVTNRAGHNAVPVEN
jgi:hypothetical protein